VNYLAHLYLSPEDDLSRLGNIMGDFTRDVDRDALPTEVLAGIRMHQSVDVYTDSHPLVRELRANFSKERRRFAGVALDVVFDHFLIKHWSRYMESELDEYVNDCYNALWRQKELMPPRMETVVSWMISKDWIGTYTRLEGVGRALDGLASRLRIKHDFYGVVDEIENKYDLIEQGFLEFFPQLESHVDELIKVKEN